MAASWNSDGSLTTVECEKLSVPTGVSYGSDSGDEESDWSTLGTDELLSPAPVPTGVLSYDACRRRSSGNVGAELKMRRKKEISRAILAMKASEKVDVCFLMDATGSMLPWLRDVTEFVSDWSQQLHQNYEYMDLRLAVVCYTDYDQPPEERIKKLDFTRNVAEFQEFVRSIKTEGNVGGDAAEDVFGGLKVAIEDVAWLGGHTKVLFHIADAPAHGERYSQHISDDYSEGDPARIDEARLMLGIKRNNIQYMFGYIRKEDTDRMIQVFNDTLREISASTMMIEQFDARSRELLMDTVYSSVCTSMSTQMELLQGKARDSFLQYSIDARLPDFSELEEHMAMLTTTSCDSAVVSVREDSPFPFEFDYVQGTRIRFKRGRKPFGQGSERLAYYAYDTQRRSKLVLKEFKRNGRRSSYTGYQEVIRVHKVAANCAMDFNQRKPHDSPSLEFVNLGLMQMPPDIDGQVRYFTCEPFIEGKYHKFNSNGGFVAKSPLYDVIQAFSHFSWSHSDGKMVICDIQGVQSDKGFLLTDPAIHHVGYRHNYGGTNMGRKGIQRFFRTHKCNDICKKMRLKPHTM